MLVKKKYVCKVCGKEFFRYQSQVRDANNVSCSRKCQGKWMSEVNVGEANPRFSKEKHKNSTCECGSKKDHRAEKCSVCAGKGFSVGNVAKISEEEFKEIVAKSTSYSEVTKQVPLSRRSVTSKITSLGLDISHFVPCTKRPYLLEEVLVKNSKITQGTLKKKVLENNLIEYICCECGLLDTWRGKPITLELHHLNGCSKDNRLENLVFLCPNCHSQTKNNKGRNSKTKESKNDK